jgi:electron transfer flavoprotein alpha subunit
MIEELATVLGAATACSKPVSDLGGDLTENTLDKQENQLTNLYIAIIGAYNTSQE